MSAGRLLLDSSSCAGQFNVSHEKTKMTFARVGITIFALAVVFGPIYTVNEYSVVSNLISELGAQHTQNNFIMIIAFVMLGVGIAVDGVRKFRVSLLPFILFGLAMAIVGIFPHKPIDASLNFNSIYTVYCRLFCLMVCPTG